MFYRSAGESEIILFLTHLFTVADAMSEQSNTESIPGTLGARSTTLNTQAMETEGAIALEAQPMKTECDSKNFLSVRAEHYKDVSYEVGMLAFVSISPFANSEYVKGHGRESSYPEPRSYKKMVRTKSSCARSVNGHHATGRSAHFTHTQGFRYSRLRMVE